jgi:hypothetical protein
MKKRSRRHEHTIPGAVPDATVAKLVVVTAPEHEVRDIRQYVEIQARPEKMIRLEKIKTEHVFNRRYAAWDVRTNRDRYWVITDPTNLYSQKDFPSLDYTISFHIGLGQRMAAKSRADEKHPDRLAPAWRRLDQAEEPVDVADEAEEFQAVGMRCRECLLAIVRSVASDSMVQGQPIPKKGDFIHWTEAIAESIAPGAREAEVRHHLKTMAKSAWQLVSWLTHAVDAVRFDALMATQATGSTLTAFEIALFRHERGVPDRCPKCTSYRVSSVFEPDLMEHSESPYFVTCESCGWKLKEENTNG